MILRINSYHNGSSSSVSSGADVQGSRTGFGHAIAALSAVDPALVGEILGTAQGWCVIVQHGLRDTQWHNCEICA
jgi:hypothetical protein